MNIILITNTLLYALLIYIVYKKNGSWPTLFVLLVYFVFALNASLIYGTDNYKWGLYSKRDLSIYPFIYTFVGFLLFALPILKFKSNTKIIMALPKEKEKIVFYVCLAVMLLGGVVNYSFATSFSDVGEAYGSTVRPTGFAAQIRVVSAAFLFPTLVMIGYQSTTFGNRKKCFMLLAAYFFNGIIEAMTCGSRGVLFFKVFHLIIVLLIFKNYWEKKTLRIIFVVMGCVMVFIVSLSLAISYSRFGDDNALSWIFSYFGEPFLNMSLYYWDPTYIWNGMSTFGRYFSDSHTINGPYMPILFKMFSGQSFMDFGLFNGFLFIILMSFIFTKIMPHKKMLTFGDMLVVMYVYCHVMRGVFGIMTLGWSAYALIIVLYFYTKDSNGLIARKK